MRRRLWVDIAGWYGMAAILTAYAGVSFGWMAATGAVFQLLNFTGAVGIVINSATYKAWPGAALNAVWTLIALVALVRITVA